ncbi:MAG: acyl-CoA dehydrogenase family protein [Deltaproteobacteria bacterium]|nr:acyl-CoA dehydrogenase family protein [Deltaproteobacteria bacterium]MBW2120778.1 acyl-CoA dehydrogenase family protein [Deltaproteobacteria bacterium]
MEYLLKLLRSFHEKEEDRIQIDRFVRLLNERVIPHYVSLSEGGVKIEENRALFPAPWKRIHDGLTEIGFFKCFIPPQYGGVRISEEGLYSYMELLGFSCPSLGIIFVAHGRAVDMILFGENEDQKSRYLPRFARGEFGAIAMTEPGAGSDVGAIEFSAERVGQEYLFNGQKWFISNSGLASVYTIVANTKKKKSPRALTAFIVEDHAGGFSVEDLPEKDGLKLVPTGRLLFQDTRVPRENMIGQEGRGLLLALRVIDKGRIHIAGICCGLAYRIFDEIFSYSRKRVQFDHPLTSSQEISFRISDMYTQINAARGLCFYALRQVDTPLYRGSSSQAKLFASQMVADVARSGQIILGGRGYLRSNVVSLLSADARGMEYVEGTTNIQRMIISSELFRGYE